MKPLKYISWLLVLIILSILIPYRYTVGEVSPLEADFVVKGDTAILAQNNPYMPDIPSKGEITAQIASYAQEYGVEKTLALDLAWFESRFNPLAENPRSTASGVYQWLEGSFKAFCKGSPFVPEHNIECAMKVISEDEFGIRHWTADLDTRAMLVNKGYVVCFDGKNNCRLN